MSMRRALLAVGVLVGLESTARADIFTYDPPGQLASGSGQGRSDMKVYAPGIRFPIAAAPAYANSQVWGHGGNSGPGGGQCDRENFSYPWHDNFCETRDWSMPLCPAGKGHQGQDIRATTCEKGVHSAIAVTDGTITHIGSYTVYLTAADGTRYDYLHMSNVAVIEGQRVKRGDLLGKVANVFDGTATTVHLHFNIMQSVSGAGYVFVPPYMSLVEAYEDLLAGRTADGGPADADPSEIPADLDATGAPGVDGGLQANAQEASSSGCACRAGSSGSGSLSWVGTAFALAAVAARRRARHRSSELDSAIVLSR